MSALTEDQIKARTAYIGGSDCAAVLGLSRWKTPLQAWSEKTGFIPVEDLSDNLAVEVGTELEDLVCRLFTKRTGKQVRRVNETMFHPSYSFIGANIDRRVVGEDAILEAKTCSAWRAREFEGENIPQEYILQAMHYLAVTGVARCYVAVLIGGNADFRWSVVDRDPMLIGEIIKKEAAFWTTYIEPKVMPQIVTKHDNDVLYKLFPHGQDEGDPVQLNNEAVRIVEGLQALESDLKTLEGVIDKEKNALKALLKDRAVGLAGPYKITWKNQETTRLDCKSLKENNPTVWRQYATTSKTRVLRIAENKKQKEAD